MSASSRAYAADRGRVAAARFESQVRFGGSRVWVPAIATDDGNDEVLTYNRNDEDVTVGGRTVRVDRTTVRRPASKPEAAVPAQSMKAVEKTIAPLSPKVDVNAGSGKPDSQDQDARRELLDVLRARAAMLEREDEVAREQAEVEARALEAAKIALRRKVLGAPEGAFVPPWEISGGRLNRDYTLEDINNAKSKSMLDDIERAVDGVIQRHEAKKADAKRQKEEDDRQARQRFEDEQKTLTERVITMRSGGVVMRDVAERIEERIACATKSYMLQDIGSELDRIEDAHRREERSGGAPTGKKRGPGQGAPLWMITGRPLVETKPEARSSSSKSIAQLAHERALEEERARGQRKTEEAWRKAKAFRNECEKKERKGSQGATVFMERPIVDRIAALSDAAITEAYATSALKWRYASRQALVNAAKNLAGKVHVEAFVAACERAMTTSIAQAAK